MQTFLSIVYETENRNRVLEMCKFRFRLVHWIDPRSIEHSYACCISFQPFFAQQHTCLSVCVCVCLDVSLSSDFITGFCGETDADHEMTLDLVRRVQYNFVFCFPYSMRQVCRLLSLRPVDDRLDQTKVR